MSQIEMHSLGTYDGLCSLQVNSSHSQDADTKSKTTLVSNGMGSQPGHVGFKSGKVSPSPGSEPKSQRPSIMPKRRSAWERAKEDFEIRAQHYSDIQVTPKLDDETSSPFITPQECCSVSEVEGERGVCLL